MTAGFDLEFVSFHCKHSECGEMFEKSLNELTGAHDVICPRCGTATNSGEEIQLLAAARTSERMASAG